MHITVKVSKFYDWEPLPAGTKTPTDADIRARRVKPSNTGGWLMRVTKELASETSVRLPESQLIALIIQDNIRDKLAHTRTEALAHYLARHVMPHHADRQWMEAFDVHDDGPSRELFEAKLDEQIKAGNIEELDRERLVEAYMRPLSKDLAEPTVAQRAEHHGEHLHKHFGVKKQPKPKSEPETKAEVQ